MFADSPHAQIERERDELVLRARRKSFKNIVIRRQAEATSAGKGDWQSQASVETHKKTTRLLLVYRDFRVKFGPPSTREGC